MHLLAECNTLEFVQHKLRQIRAIRSNAGLDNPELSQSAIPARRNKNMPDAAF